MFGHMGTLCFAQKLVRVGAELSCVALIMWCQTNNEDGVCCMHNYAQVRHNLCVLSSLFSQKSLTTQTDILHELFCNVVLNIQYGVFSYNLGAFLFFLSKNYFLTWTIVSIEYCFAVFFKQKFLLPTPYCFRYKLQPQT